MKVYLNTATMFVNRFYNVNDKKFAGQRLGQAFVNEFLDSIRGEQTQELFYADDKKAVRIIFDNFVDLNP